MILENDLIFLLTRRKMSLCEDIVTKIGSYLPVYQRLPLLSLKKSQCDQRNHVVERIKKIYSIKCDIIYRNARHKTNICILLPEPIYMKEYIETNSEIEQSNDILEVYKDMTLTHRCKFEYNQRPLDRYSLNKLVLLGRHNVDLNDHCWNLDHLERFLLATMEHFYIPAVMFCHFKTVLSMSKERKLLEMMRCSVHHSDKTKEIVDNLIEHDLFYDQNYQIEVWYMWRNQIWYNALFSNLEFVSSIKNESFWEAQENILKSPRVWY